MGKCSFNQEWMKLRPWLLAVKGDRHRAVCSGCNANFDISRGENDVKTHEAGKKHSKRIEEINSAGFPVEKKSSIKEAFKKSHEQIKKQKDTKDGVIKAEVLLVIAITNHNIPVSFSDCFAQLAPKMFPDSDIAKNMHLHRMKANYCLEFGIAPHHKEKVLDCLRKSPFSLNYDGSVVNKKDMLNINVSFRNKHDLIQKANLTTVEVTEDSTGENICKTVFKVLEEFEVPKENLVSDQTDGCSTMLGKFRGCHEFAKKQVPQLPDLGGCECHDACNCIKAGLMAMRGEMVSLWKGIWVTIEKRSAKKNRRYQEISEELGVYHRHVPHFLEVRFRSVADKIYFSNTG
jgi:hypothetical protein